MKKISRVSTIISAIMLLTYIIVLISIWSRIPDTVPTHFNAAGVADSYGSKRNLVFEPVLAAFLLLFLSLMERIPKEFQQSGISRWLLQKRTERDCIKLP